MISTRIILGLIVATLTLNATSGQETKKNWVSENLSLNGYIKYMSTSTFRNLDAILCDNLIHNRLNFKSYLTSNLTATVEIRNRMLWGNSVAITPDYASLIDSDDSEIDMSFFLIKKDGFLMLSEIDRLTIDFVNDKWHFVIGRQRINWGKNLAWNPNDIFNTYSFFDFDYEERPGTDAVRIQYYLSGNSSVETAINYKDKWSHNTIALKYNFHAGKYDFQLLAAKYLRDFMVGLGWEGAIKNLGFKGELSYFTPSKDNLSDAFVGSITFDYFFKNGFVLNVATLYNSVGISNSENVDITAFSSLKVSPKQLMPNKWSFFAQASKAFTPAINASLATIYAKELNGYFAMPQFSYSMNQNWDFDITGQMFYGKENNRVTNLTNSVFLRFRYSF